MLVQVSQKCTRRMCCSALPRAVERTTQRPCVSPSIPQIPTHTTPRPQENLTGEGVIEQWIKGDFNPFGDGRGFF